MRQKGFSRDFILVVIGQIISLTGNAALRFALPLYLLNLTGNAALYGTVMACAFLPSIALSPVGGIIADRVNKRTIMVVLDFFTAGVVLVCALLIGQTDPVVLVAATMMLLFGIAGAYQPSVQASIPALTDTDSFMAANAVINTVSSLASLLGPVLGGLLYSTYGLTPVLYACAVSFVLSAVMELFIRIPFQKQTAESSLLKTAAADFSRSIRFIRREKPVIGKVLMVICGINLFLSSMITVALPYLTTEVFDLEAALSNRLYSFAEAAMAAGGLTGGICAGIFADRLAVSRQDASPDGVLSADAAPRRTVSPGLLVIVCAACMFPVGAALILSSSGMINYIVLTLCCFLGMVCSTLFSVQMMSFIQAETPQDLIGKVIAVIFTIAMCAQPLGNALYGVLFELCRGAEYVVVLFSGVVSLAIAVRTGKVFKALSEG